MRSGWEPIGCLICCASAVVVIAWCVIAYYWVTMPKPCQQPVNKQIRQHKTKVINLGVYDDDTNTFTLPDGRVIVAPITGETRL